MQNNLNIRYALGMTPNELNSEADRFASEALLELERQDRERARQGRATLVNSKTKEFTSTYMQAFMQGLDSHLKDLEQRADRCKKDILDLRRLYEQEVSRLRAKESSLERLEKTPSYQKIFSSLCQGIVVIVKGFFEDMLKSTVDMAVDLLTGDLDMSLSAIRQRLLEDVARAGAKAQVQALSLALANATAVAGKVGGAQSMEVVSKLSVAVHSAIKNACSGTMRSIVGTVKEYSVAAANPNPGEVFKEELTKNIKDTGKKAAFAAGKSVAKSIVREIPSSELQAIVNKQLSSLSLEDIEAFVNAENPLEGKRLLGILKSKADREMASIERRLREYPQKRLNELESSAKRQLQAKLTQLQVKANKIQESLLSLSKGALAVGTMTYLSSLGAAPSVGSKVKGAVVEAGEEGLEVIQKELFSEQALKDYTKAGVKVGLSSATNAFPPAKVVVTAVATISTFYMEFCEATEDMPGADIMSKGSKGAPADQGKIKALKQQIAQSSAQIEQTNIQLINRINQRDATEIERIQYTFCEFFLIRSTNQLEFLTKSFPYMTKEEIVTVFFAGLGDAEFEKLRALTNANMLSLVLRALFVYVEEELGFKTEACPILPAGLLKQIKARYGLDQSSYCKNLSRPEVRAMIDAYNELPTVGPTRATSIESLAKSNSALFQRAEAEFVQKYLPKTKTLSSPLLSQEGVARASIAMKSSQAIGNSGKLITTSIILAAVGLAGYYTYRTYYLNKQLTEGE